MDPINVAVTVALLTVLVASAVEFATSTFKNLDGNWIRLIAVAAGIGLALLYDLQGAADLGYDGLPASLDYVVTGLVIAGAAGWAGTAKNALRAKDPQSSLYRVN